MFIINLMIITLFIYSIVLLSGAKIMINEKYTLIILALFVTYTPFFQSIEGYKLGYMGISSVIIVGIIFLSMFIWSYRGKKHVYSLHNLKDEDVIHIIEDYLQRKNIKYEVNEKKIYLQEFEKKIIVNGFLEISLNCRDIKDMDFYKDLIENVRTGIKKIKQKYFPTEGIMYLIIVGVLYYINGLLK